MDNYTVYKQISPSGKLYVGITKQDVKKRWANGKEYRNCTYFYNAIQKYGWDNFEHIILYTQLSREKACEIEKELIEELDLLNPKKGYSLKTGGRYGILTEKSKNKISQSLIGNNRRTGIPHTQETIEHFKAIRAGKKTHDWTDESREKMRQSRLGKKASQETKILLSEIRKGEGNSFYGKHHTEETRKKFRENNIKDKVIQLTVDNKFVKEWDCAIEAQRELHIYNIGKVCNGKKKSAGHFLWIYKEDYDGRRA